MNKEIAPEEKPRKSNLLNILFLVFMIGITVYFVFKDQEIKPIMESLRTANLYYIAAAMGAMFLYVFFESINTFEVMKMLGQRISVFRCIKYIFVNIYFCSITPSASGGQPFQIYYMQRDNINISHSSLTAIIVAAVYKLELLIYVGVILIFNYNYIMAGMGGMRLLLVYGILINGVLVAANIVAVLHKGIVMYVVSVVSKVIAKFKGPLKAAKFAENATIQIEEYVEGGKIVKNNPILLTKVFIFTFLQLTAFFIVPYFIYKSFGLQGTSLINVISLQAILTISVASLPLPGAVGASESGFLHILGTVFGAQYALPAMMLSRGISFYILLIVSGIVTFFVNIFKPKA